MNELAPATIATSDVVAEYGEDPQALRAFCESKGIVAEAAFAVELAKRCFPKAVKISLAMDFDPDEDEEYVALDVRPPRTVDEVVEWYHTFSREWTRSVPWPSPAISSLRFSALSAVALNPTSPRRTFSNTSATGPSGRRLARQDAVERRAQAVHIGRRAELVELALGLFGAHIGGRADGGALLSQLSVVSCQLSCARGRVRSPDFATDH